MIAECNAPLTKFALQVSDFNEAKDDAILTFMEHSEPNKVEKEVERAMRMILQATGFA
jgi:hypothetical protein